MHKALEAKIENLSLDIQKYNNRLRVETGNQLSLETKRWGDLDFVEHFYKGRGRSVSLSEIGHLYEIQRAARADGMFERFAEDLAEPASKVKNGYFTDYFENTYYLGVEFFDEFKDPLMFRIFSNEEIGIDSDVGGTNYDIIGSWNEFISGMCDEDGQFYI